MAGAGDARVSAPPSASEFDVATLRKASASKLQDPVFWSAFAHSRDLVVLGPSIHHVLDVDHGPRAGVVEVSDGGLDGLRARVAAEEWEESGLAHADAVRFGIVRDGAVLAAAGLDEWGGAPRDIGLLVDPAWRGHGLGTQVGGHAASFAVREHGRARWRALASNVASISAARRLGFQPWCTQLAVRAASLTAG